MHYSSLNSKYKNLFPIKTFGQSMLPFFQPNDVVYYKTTRFRMIKTNDIIVIKKNNKFITHRILYKTKNYLITRGDNNIESDGKIYPKQVVGKVYLVKRGRLVIDPEHFYLIQSTLYFNEIVRIKNQFDRRKINYVFLKGLPLHIYYEGIHPKRIYADCDILVDKKDFIRINEILIKKKYKIADLHWSNRIKKMQKKMPEVSYYKRTKNFIIVLDVHFQIVDLSIVHLGHFNNLYPQKDIDRLTNEFYKTKKGMEINGEPFYLLSANYLLLYLALHIFHHNFRGVFRYQFLDIVIRKSRLSINNWQSIINTVANYKLANFVYPVFVLLKKYYNTPIPKKFFASKKPNNPITRQLVNKIANVNIFNDESRIRAGITRFKNLFLLSPNPLWRKLFVFFNPQVVYSICWILWKQLFVSIKDRRLIH